MQRNNLLFKYVHTVIEKNLPSFSRVGIKFEQRLLHGHFLCSYSVTKAWVGKDNENLKKVAQIPHKVEGSKREGLVCDSWKPVDSSRTRAWTPQTSAQVSEHANPADKTSANLTAAWR